MLEKKEETQFDCVAQRYDEDLRNNLGIMGLGDIDKFAEYKVQLLKSVIGNVHNILDFGCGIGRSIKYFKKYFGTDIKIYGCDVSEKSIGIAKQNFPDGVFFVNSSTDIYAAQDNKYDVVFLACVCHHIEPAERAKWVDAIIDSLSKSGYIAVFEHNLINPLTKRIVNGTNNDVDDERWMLSHKELIELLTDGHNDEMEVFWDGYVLFSPLRFGWTTTFEKLLRKLPLGAQHCVIVKKKYEGSESNAL